MCGIMGALTGAIVPSRYSHPISVTSAWASFSGALALFFHFINPMPDITDSAVIVGCTMLTGAVFGLVMGMVARLLARRWPDCRLDVADPPGS